MVWGGPPKDTPAEIVDRLNHEINAGLDDFRIKTRLSEMSGMPLRGSPAEFRQLIEAETENGVTSSARET